MATSLKINDAFRNKHIPERFLNSLSQSSLDMFENQVCVCLLATHDGYSAKYEVEDEIRAVFMARLDNWIREFATVGTWSVVSHGTNVDANGNHQCILGFIFANFADSENFLKHFLIVEKLKS